MRVVFDPAFDRDPADGCIGAADPAFDVEAAVPHGGREGLAHGGAVVVEDMVQETLLAPGRKRTVITEDAVVPWRAARGVVHEIEIPRSHLGGFEREGEGFARGLDLAGPFLHATLERLVGEPEPLLRLLAFEEMTSCLILSPTNPQGGRDGAGQRLGIDRTLQQDDVAEALHPGGSTFRTFADPLGHQHDEGEVRPRWLSVQPVEQRAEGLVGDGLLGHDGSTGGHAQGIQKDERVLRGRRRRAAPGQHLLDDRGVAATRRQNEDAALVHLRTRHPPSPGPADGPPSRAVLPLYDVRPVSTPWKSRKASPTCSPAAVSRNSRIVRS